MWASIKRSLFFVVLLLSPALAIFSQTPGREAAKKKAATFGELIDTILQKTRPSCELHSLSEVLRRLIRGIIVAAPAVERCFAGVSAQLLQQPHGCDCNPAAETNVHISVGCATTEIVIAGKIEPRFLLMPIIERQRF